MSTSKALRRALTTAALLAGVSIFALGSAKADTFNIVGGSNHTLSSFDVSGLPGGVSNGTSVTAFTSNCSNCGITINPGTTSLTFTYLGKEATDLDQATTVLGFNNVTLFSNTASVGTTAVESYTLGSGTNFLPFGFTDTTGSDQSAAFSVFNSGSNSFYSNGSDVAIALYKVNDTTLLALFDDKNSDHPDHDYDDMVVEIQFTDSISQTPLPAAFPLFASGLGVVGGVLGWSRKKRKAVAAA